MANKPGQRVALLQGLTAYAKGSGIDYTIGNPGADSKPSYVGTVDTILIYESSGLPAADKLGAGTRRTRARPSASSRTAYRRWTPAS